MANDCCSVDFRIMRGLCANKPVTWKPITMRHYDIEKTARSFIEKNFDISPEAKWRILDAAYTSWTYEDFWKKVEEII